MTLPLSILVAHFIGDFLLQTDWMALNKSKHWAPLCIHAWVYSIVVTIVMTMLLLHHQPNPLVIFACVFIPHVVTDAITSRVTSKLWFFRPVDFPTIQLQQLWVAAGGNRHWFFTMIGFDQLLHYIALAIAYRWLYA